MSFLASCWKGCWAQPVGSGSDDDTTLAESGGAMQAKKHGLNAGCDSATSLSQDSDACGTSEARSERASTTACHDQSPLSTANAPASTVADAWSQPSTPAGSTARHFLDQREDRQRPVSALELTTHFDTASQPMLLVIQGPGDVLQSSLYQPSTTVKPYAGPASFAVCWCNTAGAQLGRVRSITSSHSALHDTVALQNLLQQNRALSAVLQAVFRRTSNDPQSSPVSYQLDENSSGATCISLQHCTFASSTSAPASPALLLEWIFPAGTAPLNQPVSRAVVANTTDIQAATPPNASGALNQPNMLTLLRDRRLLEMVPAAITLFTFSGQPLQQNKRSVEYLGELVKACAVESEQASVAYISTPSNHAYPAQESEPTSQVNFLQRLFALDLAQLEDLLEEVMVGNTWRGTLQVPRSLLPSPVSQALVPHIIVLPQPPVHSPVGRAPHTTHSSPKHPPGSIPLPSIPSGVQPHLDIDIVSQPLSHSRQRASNQWDALDRSFATEANPGHEQGFNFRRSESGQLTSQVQDSDCLLDLECGEVFSGNCLTYEVVLERHEGNQSANDNLRACSGLQSCRSIPPLSPRKGSSLAGGASLGMGASRGEHSSSSFSSATARPTGAPPLASGSSKKGLGPSRVRRQVPLRKANQDTSANDVMTFMARSSFEILSRTANATASSPCNVVAVAASSPCNIQTEEYTLAHMAGASRQNTRVLESGNFATLNSACGAFTSCANTSLSGQEPRFVPHVISFLHTASKSLKSQPSQGAIHDDVESSPSRSPASPHLADMSSWTGSHTDCNKLLGSFTSQAGSIKLSEGLNRESSMSTEPVMESAGPGWHDVTATSFDDPVSGKRVIAVVQVDVSAKVETELLLAQVMEAEHQLLEQMFPRHILEHVALGGALASRNTPHNASNTINAPNSTIAGPANLRHDCRKTATHHPEVTIMFADVVGFTTMCSEVAPAEVMAFLNTLYTRLDALLDVYGVYKVETIGDCYMVAGGLLQQAPESGLEARQGSSDADPSHASKVMGFAQALLREARKLRMPNTGAPLQVRVGLHSGPVVSGVVGMRMPRFCLFGDTVNTASRMESTCPPGSIQVTQAVSEKMPQEPWRSTGGIQVKGKGEMATYLWVDPTVPEADKAAADT